MDADGQLRNLRDFLLVYNRMTEICFQRCTTNFNYRNLTMDEERCVDNCAGKLIRSNHRLMGTYVQLMPAMVQRRMEEMESKAAEAAAEAAKAAAAASPGEPLAGSLGTPETTAVVSSATASPSLTAEHVMTAEVPAGSVSFASSIAESTLSDLSPVPAPATSGTAAVLPEPVIPSVASQTTNVLLNTERPHTGTAALPTAVSSTQRYSEVALSPVNTSLPVQGSLSSAAAAIPVENFALKVSVDDSSRASASLGLQSTAGTKDKTS